MGFARSKQGPGVRMQGLPLSPSGTQSRSRAWIINSTDSHKKSLPLFACRGIAQPRPGRTCRALCLGGCVPHQDSRRVERRAASGATRSLPRHAVQLHARTLRRRGWEGCALGACMPQNPGAMDRAGTHMQACMHGYRHAACMWQHQTHPLPVPPPHRTASVCRTRSMQMALMHS